MRDSICAGSPNPGLAREWHLLCSLDGNICTVDTVVKDHIWLMRKKWYTLPFIILRGVYHAVFGIAWTRFARAREAWGIAIDVVWCEWCAGFVRLVCFRRRFARFSASLHVGYMHPWTH